MAISCRRKREGETKMGVSVDGIISGIDTSSMIEAMTQIYELPKQTYEERIDEYEDLNEDLAGLINLIDTMNETLEDVQEIGDFRSFTAEVTGDDAEAIGVSVDGDGVAGTYEVEVNALASAEFEVTEAFDDATTEGVLSEGTIVVTYAGEETEITIDSEMSWADLANDIDEIEGVTAYVMDTGDEDTPYVMVVQGEDEGSSNTLSFDTSGLSGGETPSFKEMVSAADAELTINGISVVSDGNVLSDVVPGMELTLEDTTSSAITITVESDPETIEAKVQAFVDAYNAVVDYIDVQSVYNTDEDIKGSFVGESSVRRVKQAMASVISSEFSGLDQDLDALSFIGITTDYSSGELELDSDAFKEALLDESDQVAELFTGDEGFIAEMLSRMDLYVDSTDGTLYERQDSIEETIEDLEDQVAKYDERIARYEERIRRQFSNLESTLGQMQTLSDYLSAMLNSDSSD